MSEFYGFDHYRSPCMFCRTRPRRDHAKTMTRPWICFQCLDLIRDKFGIVDPRLLGRRRCEDCSGLGRQIEDAFENGEIYYTKCRPCLANGFIIFKKSPLILLAECAE